MNTYIFITDTGKKVGLGHFFRCIKYSYYIKKPNKVFFLIDLMKDPETLNFSEISPMDFPLSNSIAISILSKSFNF